MKYIYEIYQRIRFRFDENYGYIVLLTDEDYFRLFYDAPRTTKPDQRFKVSMGKYYVIKPEIAGWLDQHKSYKISYETQPSRILSRSDWRSSDKQIYIRFSSKENAAYFKLTWL